MNDFDESDVGEMRQQGDLRAFMRQQIRPTRTSRRADPEQPPPPGHTPGAWPAGTQPPHPPEPHPPAAWQAALDEHRDYLRRTDHPELDRRKYPCGCGACPTTNPRST